MQQEMMVNKLRMPVMCALAVSTLFAQMLVVSGAPAPAPAPHPGPLAQPSPIWRLFGFGGATRGSRAYNGPPPEGPNEYKAICRVNNPDNYAFGPGNIPAGPVCPW